MRWTAALALLLVLVPLLLFSSPEFRAAGYLGFGIFALALAMARPELWRFFAAPRPRLVLACLLVAHLASFAGAVSQGARPSDALASGIAGLTGVLGVAVFARLFLRPPWTRRVAVVALAVVVLLCVSSLAGYFIVIDWHLKLSANSPHMAPLRLALVWPSRWLTAAMGQEFWDHCNTAGYWFAIAWVLLVNALLQRPGPMRSGWGWILAFLLGVALFLTASRSAWLMIAAALPILLAGRGWPGVVRVLPLILLAAACGIAGLAAKQARLAETPVAADDLDLAASHHVRGVVSRGSSGRLVAYRALWDELAGRRCVGRGLAVTRKPVGNQLHEHSTYLATLRGGGFVALAAHLALLGVAVATAWQLARRGCRWPLLLQAAVFVGLLFDRSTVFLLTGFDEFLTHWLAVWCPLALASHSSSDPGAMAGLPDD